jgi:hypothetical protein
MTITKRRALPTVPNAAFTRPCSRAVIAVAAASTAACPAAIAAALGCEGKPDGVGAPASTWTASALR